MKSRYLLLYIAALLLLSACTGESRRMQALLEQAEEMNRTDQPFLSDSIGKALVRHYDHWWHSRNLRMRAYYMLGCAYRDMGSAPRALENYQRAVSIADTTQADCDLNVLMRVHSQMASLYLQQRLPEQEEQELQTAQRLAWQSGDTLSALIFKEHYCGQLYNRGKYHECIKRSLSLQQEYTSSGLYNDGFIPLIHCVRSYIRLKNYVLAKHYLDLYEKCPYFYTAPEKINGGLGALYIQKGQYFIAVQEADSAEYNFRRAIPYQSLWENNLLITEGLSQTYELKHNADSILKYTRLYSDAKEHSFDEARAEALTQAKSLYDYSIEQQQAKEQAERATQFSKLLVAAAILVVALTILFLYYRKRKKRKITELIQRYQTAIQELHEAEEDLNAEKLRQVNDKRLIALREENIKSLKSQVDSLKRTIQKIESGANRINIEEADIVKKIMASRMSSKTIAPDDWSSLRKLVEENHPTFYEHMNARQDLNESEYMVCVLTISGFNPTDIEVLMGKSNSFSAVTRKRLCVKVFGIEGRPQDFDRLLHQSY